MTTTEFDLERGPVIEELTVVPGSVAPAAVGRIALVVAALIACVGLAAAGPSVWPATDATAIGRSDPASTERPPEIVATAPAIVVASPQAGAVASEPTVLIGAIASRPLVSARIALLVGDAVIGWEGVRDIPAGRFEVRLDAYLPAVGLPAELSISGVDAHGPFEVRRPLTLAAAAPILIWSAESSVDRRMVVVEGTAPLTAGRVEVRIVATDGRTLGSTIAAVAVDSSRPGAEGGRLLGVGSFRGTIEVVPEVQDAGMSAVVLAAGDQSVGGVTRAVSPPR